LYEESVDDGSGRVIRRAVIRPNNAGHDRSGSGGIRAGAN